MVPVEEAIHNLEVVRNMGGRVENMTEQGGRCRLQPLSKRRFD